jgi:hypothetical protein
MTIRKSTALGKMARKWGETNSEKETYYRLAAPHPPFQAKLETPFLKGKMTCRVLFTKLNYAQSQCCHSVKTIMN